MKIKDQKIWDEWVEKNQDPYGVAIMRYAERWADLMESKIDEGQKLEDVAKDTSHEADTEGITAFMYGAAGKVLSICWQHGEELRKWHNLKYQYGNEGEKTNEEGGFLNPAVVSIGKKGDSNE